MQIPRIDNKKLGRKIREKLILNAMLSGLKATKADAPVLVVPCEKAEYMNPMLAKGYELVCGDIMIQHLHRTQEQCGPGNSGRAPGLVQCNAHYLPFKDGSFSCVLTQRFMPHFGLEFRKRAAEEMRRVTRKWLLMHYEHPHTAREFLKACRAFVTDSAGLSTRKKKRVQSIEWKNTKRDGGMMFLKREELAAELARLELKLVRIVDVIPAFSSRCYCLAEKVL
jgi:hypothetical protein